MRGYQKKVIFLKNTGSEMFDEAYFVLSERCERDGVGESNMIKEANKIIEENSLGARRRRFDIRRVLLHYGIPFGAGASTVGILWLLIFLI